MACTQEPDRDGEWEATSEHVLRYEAEVVKEELTGDRRFSMMQAVGRAVSRGKGPALNQRGILTTDNFAASAVVDVGAKSFSCSHLRSFILGFYL